MQAMGKGGQQEPAHLDRFLQHVESQGGSARLPAPPTKFIVTRSGRRLGLGEDGTEKPTASKAGEDAEGRTKVGRTGIGTRLPDIRGATAGDIAGSDGL